MVYLSRRNNKMSDHSSSTAVHTDVPLISLNWDNVTNVLVASANLWLILVPAGLLIIAWVIWKLFAMRQSFRNFEIDETQIGVGDQKLSFRPNRTDRQIAYAIWIEVSTRKIGLPISFEDDVISEIYDSWYSFFGVTRELIKQIPVQKLNSKSTRTILRLSVDVLNQGLRPHLTKWQARFRFWYELELLKYSAGDNENLPDPQTIQARFPGYAELKADLQKVNLWLIAYRAKLQELVLND